MAKLTSLKNKRGILKLSIVMNTPHPLVAVFVKLSLKLYSACSVVYHGHKSDPSMAQLVLKLLHTIL